jgi:thiopurine S-methyltransferase
LKPLKTQREVHSVTTETLKDNEKAAWLRRWEGGCIGFHQEAVNPLLITHWANIVPATDCRVLVPLCGKTKDILWLAERGHSVVGVELSEFACRAFFEENELSFEIESRGEVQAFVGRGDGSRIELLCGDFFALVAADVGVISAWFDRAAMVALPPALWPRYAETLERLLSPGGAGLMLTFEYPQEERNGPPYSVAFDSVVAQFGGDFEVELLECLDLTAENRWGLSSVLEPVMSLRRKG